MGYWALWEKNALEKEQSEHMWFTTNVSHVTILHIICHILLFVFSAKIEEKRKREEEKRNIEEEQVYYWLFKAVKMKMRESMHLK